MILAIDTSSPSCSLALFDGDGTLVAARDETIGRGHAEQLVPMIAALVAGHVPTRLLVGVGPGSFTGIRVGIAAAHGLAIGWGIAVHGLDSPALVAAAAPAGTASLAVALNGGHGELFVRRFAQVDGRVEPLGPVASLTPAAAAAAIDDALVLGSGAAALVAARGHGTAMDALPAARHALALPAALRTLAPAPVYARAPDAVPAAARAA